MRLSVLIAAVAVLFPAMDMQAQTASGKKVLVAYFSHSGNTREMARQIAEATNGDLFEIVPQSAYPAQYDAVTAQAKREIGRGYRPALKGRLPDIGAYDVVFVGSPCWWGTVAPPVATFLAVRLGGKDRCAVHDARGQPHGPQRGRHRKALSRGYPAGRAAGARQCREGLAGCRR